MLAAVLLLTTTLDAKADPPSQTTEQILAQASAEMEKQRLKDDPSDRPSILGSGELGASEAGPLSNVNVDCGHAPSRNVNGRLHVRCRVVTTTIEHADVAPIEEEISTLDVVPTMGAKAFDEACNYIAGKPLRPESDPNGYHFESKIWSRVLAIRLDEARRQTTEGQRPFLAGVVQACQSEGQGTVPGHIRDFHARCRGANLPSGELELRGGFRKGRRRHVGLEGTPGVCRESSVLTLFRAPGRGLWWNYRDVETYPAPPPEPLCPSLAGKTEVHEYVHANRRLREPGCRYVDL